MVAYMGLACVTMHVQPACRISVAVARGSTAMFKHWLACVDRWQVP